MDVKTKIILRTAKKLGYDVNNPKSIVYKTITDTINTSLAFMTKQEIIDFLKSELKRIEGN